MEALREKHGVQSIIDEAAEIDRNFRSLTVGNLLRKININCFAKCGGDAYYPFAPTPNELQAAHSICFGDCMNINLERGPYLNELGEIPEGKIAKKFIWANPLPVVKAEKEDDGDDEDEDGDDEDDE